jgi:hypothetical protein
MSNRPSKITVAATLLLLLIAAAGGFYAGRVTLVPFRDTLPPEALKSAISAIAKEGLETRRGVVSSAALDSLAIFELQFDIQDAPANEAIKRHFATLGRMEMSSFVFTFYDSQFSAWPNELAELSDSFLFERKDNSWVLVAWHPDRYLVPEGKRVATTRSLPDS